MRVLDVEELFLAYGADGSGINTDMKEHEIRDFGAAEAAWSDRR